ncbi:MULTISPECIES: hypothetical protein [unclassified Micromonospora]|uniref:hypothetical protein n=1 Tax=unclassified Micromonospora TaxID=2617518 RepID=UPI0022B6030D|nr:MULTISPECIES: hypothetical protein [unclassified Micromonospora]MCZ7421955.1 hypothetical protein [Verrucosispora sp. WMMA2121]WBB93311.1 hypothetical protein O7597_10200 [Verrucosispora sp. WMMC514]
MILLDVVAVFLLLQGFGSLAQRLFGQNTEESFFIVNKVPELQPFASIALGVAGLALLFMSSLIRKARKRSNGNSR